MDTLRFSGNPLAWLVLLMVCLSIIGSILAAGVTYTSASQSAQTARTSVNYPTETASTSANYPAQNALQPPSNEEQEEEPQEE